ncbi:MAG: hypothetical protein SFX73_12525 [Kofleriaceae bacterium]|nr:hypothetical protein [Kofleriaceae bacterium]
MLRIGLVLLVVAAGAGVATADGPIPITLRVGQTLSLDVGFAMGSFCDDPTVVRAAMRDSSFESNAFVVTGLKEGTTLCRAGRIDESARPSFLFVVTVVR